MKTAQQKKQTAASNDSTESRVSSSRCKPKAYNSRKLSDQSLPKQRQSRDCPSKPNKTPHYDRKEAKISQIILMLETRDDSQGNVRDEPKPLRTNNSTINGSEGRETIPMTGNPKPVADAKRPGRKWNFLGGSKEGQKPSKLTPRGRRFDDDYKRRKKEPSFSVLDIRESKISRVTPPIVIETREHSQSKLRVSVQAY